MFPGMRNHMHLALQLGVPEQCNDMLSVNPLAKEKNIFPL